MFITFYDKDFNAINDNSSLNIEKYSLARRSYDLNTFTCTCEPIDLSVEPMFAVVRENTGQKYYDCLAPIVTRNTDNKSSVIARDLKAVFNTEVVIDFTQTVATVQGYFELIFASWENYVFSGFDNITFTTDFTTTESLYMPTEKAVYNVLDLFKKGLAFYELYLESSIDIKTSTLNFTVKNNNLTTEKVILEDYGVIDFGKSKPSTNVAVASSEDFITTEKWYLLKDGTITMTSSLQDLFPASTMIFTNSEFEEARYDAVMELADNRNQEAIALSLTSDDRLYDIDFGTDLEIYYNNALYKTLPIGEISENQKGERTVTIGYKPVDLIQII